VALVASLPSGQERTLSAAIAGIGLAVDAIGRPAGPLAHEARELARLAGEAEASALMHLLSRMVATGVPAFDLMDLFDRWAGRLEALGKAEEGSVVRIRHRVSRGQHQELEFAPGLDRCGRRRRR
jgi:hypothetical protein